MGTFMSDLKYLNSKTLRALYLSCYWLTAKEETICYCLFWLTKKLRQIFLSHVKITCHTIKIATSCKIIICKWWCISTIWFRGRTARWERMMARWSMHDDMTFRKRLINVSYNFFHLMFIGIRFVAIFSFNLST